MRKRISSDSAFIKNFLFLGIAICYHLYLEFPIYLRRPLRKIRALFDLSDGYRILKYSINDIINDIIIKKDKFFITCLYYFINFLNSLMLFCIDFDNL